ncbi:putative reverse transcriptase domain-containing protein [Tanacetum coccineum]
MFSAALEVGIGIEANVGVEVGIRIKREDEVEEEAKSGDRGTIDIGVNKVSDIKSAQKEQGRRMLAASETMPTATRSGMTPSVIEEMIEWRMAEALEAYKANRNCEPIMESGDEHEDDNGDDNGNGASLAVPKMVPEEEDRVEKFIGGLSDNNQGNVIAAEPTRLQDVIRIANNLMDQKLKGYAANNVENKRRFDNNSRNNRVQQPPFKRQNIGGYNVARAYTVEKNEKRGYAGPLPYCKKAAVAATAQRALVVNQRVVTCFGCGGQGHYKSDYPKLKNRTHGNKAANNDACGRAYALGGGDGNPDSNIVTGTFLLNNRYAYILFDYGDDKSFVSTTFSALIDITPTALDISYIVELADGRIAGSDTIIRGCTLNFLDHQFNIDLMPVKLGCFEVIIGMDWLSKYHFVIVCDKTIVRIGTDI